MEIATDSVVRTKIRRDNRKRLHSLFPVALAGVLVGLSSAAFAEHQDSSTAKDWRWEQIEPLFPHAPGTRWVYALSGKQYANDRELHVEVKGQQHVPHLKQEVLLVEETHPAIATDTTPEILPVLYYPREGYLVRDTAYIYSNPQRTSLISTGNLGEAVTPTLPLWRHNDGTDWKPVDEKHWAKASKLNIAYHIHPKKRETVAVKAGEYKDCVPIEGTVNRGDGSGYRLKGEVLLHKELLSFHVGSSSHSREWCFSYRRPSSRMMMS